MQAFKDHFSSNAAGYAAYRPSYPAALVDYLTSLLPRTMLAWDCACGTGQLSILLGDRFARVIATDASAQQIENAAPHPHVEYRVVPAECSGLPDANTDLITVAQAAHWLPLEAFYTEVRRVACPDAVLALITYCVLHVEGQETDAVVQRFYYDLMGPYWPPERKHVENGYQSLPFPFRELQAPLLSMRMMWDLDAFIGYIHTWSSLREAEKVIGDEPMEAFRAELAEAWGNPATRRLVRWPLYGPKTPVRFHISM